MATYKVWVDAKRGSDYYYRTTSKKAAGKKILELSRKGRLNSVMRSTRKGERPLSRPAVSKLVKAHLGKDRYKKLTARYRRR